MSWEIIGNAGTDPAVNFLGTTDQQPLVIRVGGLETIRASIPVIDGLGNTVPGLVEMGRDLSCKSFACTTMDISEQINFNDVPMFTTGRGQKPTALVISGAIVIATSFTTDENVLGQSPGPAPGSVSALTITATGLIESKAGFKFPDGTVQTTKTLKGDTGTSGRNGQNGATGAQGPPGPPGPPGRKTVAVCSPNACQIVCGVTVAGASGPCEITSDTGSCSTASGFCCVCA